MSLNWRTKTDEETGEQVYELTGPDKFGIVDAWAADLISRKLKSGSLSLGSQVTAGGTTALFTGDAEADVETEIMKTYGDRLDADILKVGHHGSSGSTTGEWLSAVSPRFASISCGKNNDYGHPHQATMNRLGEAGVEYYRTDKDGDVVLLCKDGKIAKK